MPHGDWVLSVALSPDGKRALTGTWGGKLQLWNVADAGKERDFKGHAGRVCRVGFSADGRHVYSVSHRNAKDNMLRVWDAQTGEEIRNVELSNTDQVTCALFRDGASARGSTTATSSSGWEAGPRDGEGARTRSVRGVSPDGAGPFRRRGQVRLWKLKPPPAPF
jgi:WD40 repeat protein